MTEWRTVSNWPMYSVSDDGRVRRDTQARRQPAPRELSQWKHKCGYFAVSFQHEGKRASFFVHQLVCAAFHGPAPSPRHEVAHWDGTRNNNAAENLRWVTRKENMEDARRHGTLLRGERQNGAKLVAADILVIRERYAAGCLAAILADEFNVHEHNIGHIVRGTTWAHVGGPLTHKGSGWAAGKTHCKRGHPLAGNNIYVYRGKRHCITCQRDNVRRHRDAAKRGSSV